MAKIKSSKVKALVILGAVLVTLGAAVALLAVNMHHLFVIGQDAGLFRTPVEIERKALRNVQVYSVKDLENDPRVTFDQSLMLVNTEYTLANDFVPDIEEYKETTVYMSRCMLDAYASLSADVKQITGKKLYVSSDFRTKEEQEALYLEDPLTATLPGASEHQTGLSLDVYVAYYAGDGFIKSFAGRFVGTNSWRYGFIIRYPSYAEDVTGIRYEPWHIRYVGHPHADVIYNNHTTLEEYVLSLSVGEWYEIEGYLVCRQALSEQGTLELPESFEKCVISPDNTGYYIITVTP
ncbi:MAG: D-alanyl-D-alanine carboxypeptidase family protein [Clostridia bacterium]|nr:D-alanyl-D-alanine carboxypeptidase family protein [Clostridia bacterium]